MLQKVREQLRSSDEETRRMTVAGLSSYPFDRIREFLYEALGEESWRVRKEALEVLFTHPLTEQTIEELVGLLRSSDNAGLRNSACEALEKLGKKSLPVLCRYIADNDHDVRKFVTDILGNIGATEAVPLLVGALRDPDPNVVAAAAENLGKIGDEGAVSELVKLLDPNNIPLCYTVLEALGRIGRPVPLDAVLPLAEEVLLKKPVIDCIGAIGDVEAIPLLIDGLREKARHVRTAAANALVGIREKLPTDVVARRVDPCLRELAGTPFVAELLSSIKEGGRQLSEPMVNILGLIGDPQSVELLLDGCRDDRLRRGCLQAFRDIGITGISMLIGLFAFSDEEHRCYIIYICGELGVRESVEIQQTAMRDPNHVLRRVAAVAAGNIGDQRLIPGLATLLDDEELDVRVGAVESLARLAVFDASTVAELADRLAADEHPEKRRSSATLYAALQDIARLARLIKDEDAHVRKAAVFSLAELKSQESTNHLVLALVDEEPDVRMAAASALGALGGDQAVQSLLVALSDRNPWVKCAALRSLGTLRVNAAEPIIVELIEHAEGLVLMAALNALVEINGGLAHQMAKKALEHQDQEVVKAAVEILSLTDDSWIEEYGDRLLSHEYWDIRRLFINALARHRGKESLPLLRSALESEPDDLVKQQIMDLMEGLA